MKKYGYIRVSAKDQNIERQYAALVPFELPKKQIYIDKESGKNFDRPGYQKLLKKLKKGDLVIVKSIDRLGRNYTEILEQWRNITKVIGADIMVIDMPLLDTTKKTGGGLEGVFIADLVLQILAYVAETERAFIKQRQAEGIAAAKAKGIHFGKERQEMPENFETLYNDWVVGKITLRRAADCLGVSHTTFYRRCKEKQGEGEGQNRKKSVKTCK